MSLYAVPLSVLFFWICLFCVLRVCELFGETIRNMFGCVCYFVVNVMELLSVIGGVPSICFVCVFVCRKLSPHLGV